MCWSRDISILAFVFITCGSLMLKYYGNSEYKQYNNILCYFFIFVGLMQLIDLAIWSDIKCNKYYNKIATILGMILNYLQPFILFILIIFFSKEGIKSKNTKTLKVIKIINYMYLLIIIMMFIHYIIKYIYKNKSACSKIINSGHIKWLWSDKYIYGYLLYNIVMVINIYLIYIMGYNLISPILSYVLLLISYIYFNQNIGELWCFFVVIIPIVELLKQNIYDNNILNIF